MERVRLGLFDVDGTIRSRGKISPEIERGFRNLWETEQVSTTVVTGRGYVRLREILGNKWQNIISAGLPVALENAGRITTQTGENIRYYPLSTNEIVSTLQIINRSPSEVLFVAHFPELVEQKPVIWTPDSKEAEKFNAQYGHFADITTSPLSDLEKRIRGDNPCMIMVKPRSPEFKSEFKNANAVFNEGEINIMTIGVHKGKGVEDISSIADVPLINCMIAGNDDNDISMFYLPIGVKIVVGDRLKDRLVSEKNIAFIPTPEELGNYLSVWKMNQS